MAQAISPLAQLTPMGQFSPTSSMSSLATMVQGLKPIAPQNNAYQPKDMSSTTLPQFDLQRGQVNSAFNQEQSQGQDALDREFAAMGGGPGNGAQVKQTENLAAGIANAKGNALSGINEQEASTRTALQQQENQMGFQSQEAEKARNAELQQYNQQTGLDANSKLAQMDMSWQQTNAQNQETAASDAYNAELNGYQAQHSGGLFGGGGFMGLGSWFCSEANRVLPLFRAEKKALRVLLNFAAKEDRALCKFYLKHCAFLIPKAKEKNTLWENENNFFIREICLLVLSGEVKEAYLKFRSYLFETMMTGVVQCQ